MEKAKTAEVKNTIHDALTGKMRYYKCPVQLCML